MYSIKALQDLFADTLSNQKFTGYPPELYDPVTYTLSLGGKRLRPVLLLAGCDLFGGDVQKAMFPAMGVEIFHNFTLLHDDIMDKAPLRRGKPTVYKKWNTNSAILSGDTMFALAYQQLLQCDHDILPDVLRVFTRTTIEVCEGQQLDMNFETRNDVSIADYVQMIRLKTAVLFACSLKIGAMVGGATAGESDLLYHFGENMGIAFQLQDDLLDVFSDQEKFGKKTGGDIAANKKTYLYLKALEMASGDMRDYLIQCYSNPSMDDAMKISQVMDIYTILHIHELTREKMNEYYHLALDNLDRIRVSPVRKEPLRAMMDEMMAREF